MKKIGFLIYDLMDSIEQDEQYLIPLFKEMGIEICPVIWDDEKVDWKGYDLLVFRSTWDYFKKVKQFEQFLEFLETLNIPVWNSLTTIKKNYNKTYLIDFEKSGIKICPTLFNPKGKQLDITGVMMQSGWDACIVKPSISGGAFHTYRIRKDEAKDFQNKFNILKDDYILMLQPYFSEIETSGERSLIYFDKKFSHAAVKQVSKGDFRVQKNFGGTMQSYLPTKKDLAFANEILSQIEEDLLYARVDFIESENQLFLMELELFEPSLYLINEEAKANFAQALKLKLEN